MQITRYIMEKVWGRELSMIRNHLLEVQINVILNPRRLRKFEQFDTFRSSRSEFSTVRKAPIKLVLEGASLEEDHRRNTVITKCSTQTIWFKIFVRGLELQFGSKSRPDQAIIIAVMKLLMKKTEVAVKGEV